MNCFASPIFQEAKILLRLAVPAFIAQISMVSMGFVDMAMTGRVGPTDMAGVALAASIWMPIILFCQGILMAVTPLAAQAHGEGNLSQSGHVIRQGLYLALILAFFCILLVPGISYMLENLGVSGNLAIITAGYLRAIAWGIVPFLLFAGLCCGLEGLGIMKPAMFAGFLGLLANIPCNYILIFGKCGFPAMGGIGTGYATALVYWVMFLVVLIYAQCISFRKFISWRLFRSLDMQILRKIFHIGLPGALSMLVEISLFAGVALLLAPLGDVVVAGHQVAMNVSSFIFMLPLAINIAATIRTGYGIGMQSLESVRCTARTSLMLAIIAGSCTAVMTLLWRASIAKIYGGGNDVFILAVSLLVYDAVYQIPDAVQCVSVGILRGYNDTRALFFISLIAYWLIALPIGYSLGRSHLVCTPMGAAGFWIAFIIGIFTAAILLVLRIRVLEKNLAAQIATVNRTDI